MKEKNTLIILSAIIFAIFLLFTSLGAGNSGPQSSPSVPLVQNTAASVPTGYSFYHYDPANAVAYAKLVDSKYYHQKYYPSGINQSQLQKNLDYFYNSEDCAHFVSEALIAGGMTVLANNPPGDNLVGYDGGAFVGSYGIVGVYRLVDFLAGYHLPLFSTNSTVESKLGYQPIPASYSGSPLASIYYVTNDSMYPAWFLSPGDMVADGGAGGGHAMMYIGGGTVVQTDPAGKWQYAPGPYLGDPNISFYGMDTLNGQNVSSLYIHMPTFSSVHTVAITVLSGGNPLKDSTLFSFTTAPAGQKVTLIGSFPDGVGIGNYTYTWYDNGKLISNSQTLNFMPQSGTNSLVLDSTGSNGTATTSFTFYSGSVPASAYLAIFAIGGVIVAIGLIVYLAYGRKK